MIRLYKNDTLVLKKQKHMRIFIITIIISCLALSSSFGQTYIKPKYKTRTNPRVNITKIQTTNKYTVVYCKYISTTGGYASINSTTYLQDIKSKQKYKLIKAEDIPISPRQRPFQKAGYTFEFKLYFERLPHKVRYLNMIESALNGFSFYNIYLQPLA